MAPDAGRTTEWSTQSNVEDAWATHLHLDVEVLFVEKKLRGYVEFEVECKPGVKTFDLDTRDLAIEKVTVDGCEVPINKGPPHRVEAFGQLLSVPISTRKPKVRVTYSTSPESSACQWLDPSATAGGKYPYLFTQCQAIHARSLLPCQDAPAAKCPMSAMVRVPPWATALMSALEDTHEDGAFSFKQPLPIPSYLIALAVGQLESRTISSRVKVWSEPSVVEAAHHEFSETEAFLKKAEELMDLAYPWGRYDLLCMPPSFPYGGMENPCLTFVTPTLLAGDRSLADVVAHEIAHSWTGNIVTNHTWEHFWLNEGWTVWAERHIVAGVRGRKDSNYFSIAHYNGWCHLRDDIKLFSDNGNSGYTALIPNLEGVDPDDSFSSVPYEKGFNLLYSIQKKVGDAAFMKFSKAYIAKFKFGTVTSQQFMDFCTTQLPETKKFDWDALYFGTGLPEIPSFNMSVMRECEQFAEAIAKSGPAPPKETWQNWAHEQRVLSLEHLLTLPPLSVARLQEMNQIYGINQMRNAEIKFRYFQLCLMQSKADFIYPEVINMVSTQGRMKFTRPLYRSLAKISDEGYALAKSTFEAHADSYHPICRRMVKADLDRVKPTKGVFQVMRSIAPVAGVALVAYMAYRIQRGKCPIPGI